MKKTNLLYLLAILAIISGLLLYYLPDMTSGHNAESNQTSQTFKEKTIVHDFGTTKLKKVPKRIVILDNLYGEILNPLDITPVGATTGQADSQEFSTLFKKQYKDAKVVSVGWQGNPDLDKIAELKPDLILMTGEQEDLYEELSEIAPTVGYQINTDENWDYHETSLKVAEIFDKRDEMKKDLDRVDAREAVFAENVKAKFGNQKLMYLRVTDNDIRYYAYGHFGYLYDTYHFNRAETFNPDDMFQVIDPDKLKDINPDLLIVQADSQELLDNKLKNNPVWSSLKAVQNNKVIYADYSTYMLGFGIVSQEAIMKQISDEWGLN
ncbi:MULTISPECIES: iron-siderophore ABC transporter substrate-binding protein [Streptococcus]|jgi:putative ferric anguibactin-binding protein|uniref:Iron-siderophore ABC transporter substrate-binding protein n=1 Tax=Streptococcus salivarius TaxID=1304 RepID=A0AB35IUW2_STRSL|nr:MULTISPECIES: iron-siderophore ABC transporter substrate-binding protein [Streptococcus]MDU3885225.1 iron-siderophore ABC transporter substrate-binding protein [Streptococcus mitis]MBK5128689.1 iron-siderophore ABC transporter substrate-binding protein [Streptococcus salivarius]MCB7035669.1 iron-siderophore ABC transporter substrate-binding protein [Streptococcus salivarius]MDB8604345.1 iron-siderophore ABC transporter substrate-binding protein [Streptococcus salivarius]MDB8606176.1 iron-si